MNGSDEGDKKFKRIQEKLIASEPFKALIAHMAESKKWRQINAYLVRIKSATTIEALIAAVEANPKDINFKITSIDIEKVKEKVKRKETLKKTKSVEWDFEEMEPEEQEWKYEKSMRENTGNHWYGIFHRGRSTTEQYALALDDKLNKLLLKENIRRTYNKNIIIK